MIRCQNTKNLAASSDENLMIKAAGLNTQTPVAKTLLAVCPCYGSRVYVRGIHEAAWGPAQATSFP